MDSSRKRKRNDDEEGSNLTNPRTKLRLEIQSNVERSEDVDPDESSSEEESDGENYSEEDNGNKTNKKDPFGVIGHLPIIKDSSRCSPHKTERSVHNRENNRHPPSGSDNQVVCPITFKSCGGLESQIQYIKDNIIDYYVFRHIYEKSKQQPPKGILFQGPPGTGKTLLAQAISTELSKIAGTKFSFFARKGPEMLSKWVGKTESNIRQLFAEATANKPSLIFLDEVDSMLSTRNNESTSNSHFKNGVVAQFLTCMDSIKKGEVLVIGATNRIDALDPAFRRPGRFDAELQFSPPNEAGRLNILRIYTQSWERPPPRDILQLISKKTIGYSGADLEQVCCIAWKNGFKRARDSPHCRPENYNVDVTDWTKAITSLPCSSSNVFGNRRFNGQVIPEDALKLIGGIKENAKRKIDEFLRPNQNIFDYPSMDINSLFLCSSDEALDEIVLPALLNFDDGQQSNPYDRIAIFKLENRDLQSDLQLENFFAQVFHSKTSSSKVIIYIPNLKQKIQTARANLLGNELLDQLRSIRGKSFFLLATGTNISEIPVSFKLSLFGEEFYKDNTFNVREASINEIRLYFQSIFSENYAGTQINVNGRTRRKFIKDLDKLLNETVEKCVGDQINHIFNLKGQLMKSVEDERVITTKDFISAYKSILNKYKAEGKNDSSSSTIGSNERGDN